MLRIKRTKKPPPPSEAPPAVHYAVSVAPAGNITGWTPDIALAAELDDATCNTVRAFYKARENVGELKFERLPPRPAAAVPVVEEAPVAAPEKAPPAVGSGK